MASPTLLEIALGYVARGYSVIPLRAGEKVPDASVLPLSDDGRASWTQFQNRRASEDELRKWFEDGTRNIGIVTGGLSGIDVIDCDLREALDLATKLGVGTVPTVKTPRGYHFYFLHADGMRNFAGRDEFAGIDCRAEGGYVVAPPSVNAEKGSAYRWEGEDRELLSLPKWARDYTSHRISTPATRMSSQSVEELLFEGASEGSRNDSIARVVGKVAASLPIDVGRDVALWFNERRCTPPLPEREVVDVVRSIYGAEGRKAEREGLGSDVGTAGEDASSNYTILVTDSENAEAPPPVDFVVPGLILRPDPGDVGCITNLNAPGGTSKSYLTIYIAVQLALGGDIFGRVARPCRTLILDAEAGRGTFGRRLAGICRGLGLNRRPAGVRHLAIAADRGIHDAKTWREIRRLIDEFKPDLIIVDSFNALCVESGRETSKVANVMPALRRLKSLGAAILLIDHTGHADKSRPMDSVAKINDARCVINLEKKGNGVVALRVTKANDIPEVEIRYRVTFNGRDPRTDFAVRFDVVSADTAPAQPKQSLEERIIEAVQRGDLRGELTGPKVASILGHASKDSVKNVLRGLREKGFVTQHGRKWYFLPNSVSGYVPTPRVGDIPKSTSGAIS